MFSSLSRGRRGPHILLIRDSEEPIRLDEAGLIAVAIRLFRSFAVARRGRLGAQSPEETAKDGVALGERRRKPYVWVVEAESDVAAAEPAEAGPHESGPAAQRQPLKDRLHVPLV
jgi:hypothetical protein